MSELMLRGVTRVSEPIPAVIAARNALRIMPRQPRLVLRSRTPGRERWYADVVEDNPLLAAAVALVLRSEEGIEQVRANPITGKVLIQYRPESTAEPVENLLRRAIEAGPLSWEEFAALRHVEPKGGFSKRLLTAEIACCLSHLVLFAGLCPLGLAATGVFLLLHRSSATHTHA